MNKHPLLILLGSELARLAIAAILVYILGDPAPVLKTVVVYLFMHSFEHLYSEVRQAVREARSYGRAQEHARTTYDR